MSQVVCSPLCAIEHSKQLREKQNKSAARIEKKARQTARREMMARLDELKPLQHWLKAAEKPFNKWIREVRDVADPCISCGTWDSPEWHAGHFIPGTAHYTRFDEANVNKQCQKCNTHLSANLTNYEVRLEAKIGRVEVDRLKNSPRVRKFTREELQAIKTDYTARLKTGKVNDGR